MCELQSSGSFTLELERPGFPFWLHHLPLSLSELQFPHL